MERIHAYVVQTQLCWLKAIVERIHAYVVQTQLCWFKGHRRENTCLRCPMAKTSACRAEDPGSIPGVGVRRESKDLKILLPFFMYAEERRLQSFGKI